MERRGFLKWMGFGAAAIPLAVLAEKETEKPFRAKLREPFSMDKIVRSGNCTSTPTISMSVRFEDFSLDVQSEILRQITD